MIIVGLDVSTHTGIAVFRDTEIVHREVVHHPPQLVALGKPSAMARYMRYSRYTNSLTRTLRQFGCDRVYVEGYAMGYGPQSSNTISMLIEIGCLLRQTLYQHDLPWYEVSPSTLKKFVTGAGNAKKDLMMLEVYKRFRLECRDDNEADAVSLAYFGAAHAGIWGSMPREQLRVAMTYSDQPAPKKRKTRLTNAS